MRKKVLSLLLSLAMVACMMPAMTFTAFAAEDWTYSQGEDEYVGQICASGDATKTYYSLDASNIKAVENPKVEGTWNDDEHPNKGALDSPRYKKADSFDESEYNNYETNWNNAFNGSGTYVAVVKVKNNDVYAYDTFSVEKCEVDITIPSTVRYNDGNPVDLAGGVTCTYNGKDVKESCALEYKYSRKFPGFDWHDIDYIPAGIEDGDLNLIKYKVTVSVPDDNERYTGTATSEFSIGKGIAKVTTTPGANNKTYDGNEANLVTEGTATNGDMYYALGEDATNAPTTGWRRSIPKATNADTYYVWYRAVTNKPLRYDSSEPVCVTVTINKAEPKYTAPTGKMDLTYTGSEQQLVTAGSTTDGTVMYQYVGSHIDGYFDKLADNKWVEIVPKATAANQNYYSTPRNYGVYYKIVGDNNHLDTKPVLLKAHIAKADVTATDFAVTPLKQRFNGKSHKDDTTVSSKWDGFVNYVKYFKQGNTEVTDPTMLGDYDVYVKSNGNDNVNSFFDIKIGTMKIVFVPENECIVSFNMQGHGEQILDIADQVIGNTIEMPKTPVAEGFEFGGWFKDAACTQAWDFVKDLAEGDMTLYAKWTAVEPTPEVQEDAITAPALTKTYKNKSGKLLKNHSFQIKDTAVSGRALTFKKLSGNKKITVSSTGKVTAKKGLKKGTYKVKVLESVGADDKWTAAEATKTITVKVAKKK